MEEEIDLGPIMYLPNEIICIIMQKLECRDIIHFGSTCKNFYELVTSSQFILKEKFKAVLPHEIVNTIEKHGNGNWLDEVRRFYHVKHVVYDKLTAMSPQFYWRTSDITLDDISTFWSYVLKHNLYYHYVIYILQDVIVRGNLSMERNHAEKPFTMTEVFYAKIVVRYLIQTFLTVKWVHYHSRNELTPEVVVNFFVQWTDPINRHPDDTVKNVINILVESVENCFPNDATALAKGYRTVADRVNHGLLDQKQVLEAISEVLYLEYELTLMHGANFNGLDIVKVFQTRSGHIIAIAVLYQAVARQCGVHCELIAFPNHLFLEWRSPVEQMQTYKIDLETGEIHPQGRCPYAPTSFRKEYKYNPDAFIQYIVSTFLMTMGAIKNWYTRNAVFLLDFLGNNPSSENPYQEFLPNLHALVDFKNLPKLDIPLNIEYIHIEHLHIIDYLINMNRPPTHFTREVTVKHHNPNVKFGVGMLAYHNKRDYLCVIRGWDATCVADWGRRLEINLEYGFNQPFYSVIAVDQAERYVPQENLIGVDRPTRLFHLEDVIAKEFSHFDGYCYVPNTEKFKEYPGDEAIRQTYRNIAEQKEKNLREAL